MSEFFVPPDNTGLNLTTNSEYVVSGLSSDKSSISASSLVLDKPVGIASSAISRYQIPAKKLDEELISNISSQIQQINSKKQEIVDLSNIAIAGYVPGVNFPICQLASNPSEIDSSITSETGVLEAANSILGSLSGLPGVNTPSIAYGVVRKDAIRVWRAPYLEQRIAPNDNSFENLKYPILTSNIAGTGKENIIFENSKYDDQGITIYCWDDAGNWSTDGWKESGDNYGRYYKITGPGLGTARLAGVYDSVTQIYTLDPEYSSMTGILTGITTGNYSAGGNEYYVEYNPTTGELTPLSLFFLFPIPSGPGYFTFSSVGICNSLISQIETLENEISTLRVGLSTFLEPPNTLKAKKHAEQLKMWSLKRTEINNATEVSNIGIATSSVITIDPSLPITSTSFDDTLLSKFDNNVLRFDRY